MAPPDKTGSENELARALSWVEGFLVAVYVALRVFLASPDSLSIQIPFIRVSALLLIFTAILRITLGGRVEITNSRLMLPVGLCAVVVLGSALTGIHPSVGLGTAVDTAEISIVLVVLALSAHPKRRARLLLAVIAGAATAVVAYGLFQKYVSLPETAPFAEQHAPGLLDQPWARERLLKGEPFGPFITTNILAGYLLFVLPLVAVAGWFAIRARSMKTRGTTALLVAACGLFLIWASGAKGAWMGLVMGLIAVEYLHHRRSIGPWVFWGIIALSVTGSALLALLSGPLSSMGIRAGYWLGGMKALADHPMGIGVGAFGVVYPHYKPVWGMEVRSLHSAYMSALVEGGPMLLLAFLYLVHSLYRAGTDLSSEAHNPANITEQNTSASGHRDAAAVTSGLGLLGGWLLAAVWFAAMGGGYVLHSLGAPTPASLAKTGIVLLGPACALVVFCLIAGGEAASVRRFGPVYLVGLTAFLVHASVDMLWEVPAIVSTVVLTAWCLETKREPNRLAIPPYLRLVLAGSGAAAVAVATICFVIVPMKVAFALDEAHTNALRHNQAASALNALADIARHAERDAKPSGDAVRALMNAFSSQDHERIKELLQNKQFDVFRLRIGDALQLTGSAVLESTAEAVRLAPADDRVAEQAARLLLDVARKSVQPARFLVKSAEFCQRARKQVPDAAKYWTLAAGVMAEAEMHEEASLCFQRAAELNPTSPLRWLAAGDSALFAFRIRDAARRYQQAMSLNFHVVEEKASLYTLTYYHDLIPWPPVQEPGEFQITLAALIETLAKEGVSEGAGPFLFRAALEDLRARRIPQAMATFNQLARFYVGDDGTCMKAFAWACRLRSNAEEEDVEDGGEELLGLVPYPDLLHRMKRRLLEAR